MSFLTVPTHPKCTIDAEHILLIRSKVMVVITITKGAVHKNSNPIFTPFLGRKVLAPLKNPLQREFKNPSI